MSTSLEGWARLVYRYRTRPTQLDQVHALLVTTGFFFLPWTLCHSSPSPEEEDRGGSVFVYNILIAGSLLRERRPDGGPTALRLFIQMLAQQTRPNGYTFPPLVKSITSSPRVSTGRAVHAQLVRRGLVADNFVNSGMVKFYAQSGEVTAARKVFDENPRPDVASCNAMLDSLCKNRDVGSAKMIFDGVRFRDVVSWTTLINGFLVNGLPEEAIRLFRDMATGRGGVAPPPRPNEATLVCALSACASSLRLPLLAGKQLHGYILRRGVRLTAFLGTALVDMYGKRGRARCAANVFEAMAEREVCTWNAMISALACNGEEARALGVFGAMAAHGVRPNGVTFVAALTACARARLVDAGMALFASMPRDHGIAPAMEHCGCVVDLLGRAALLDEAAEFIEGMPFAADASVWGALLGACRLHGNTALAAVAGARLLALQPRHAGRYAVLWNTYAGVGMWGSAARLKESMERAGVTKTAGCSWLETTPAAAAAAQS
ncbi:unnamed protein product [Spirodela intermedia]|uniref:Uncharacterized protein n=1 Tax=Spirodela intermedia TaxID=51605 RepID=A0A7I8LEF1_SPIIN|nr:unnamed protein product [Spirodela intermedia]